MVRSAGARTRCHRPRACRRWCRAVARWRPTAQVLHFKRAGLPSFAIDPLAIAAGEDVVAQALAWAEPLLARAGAGLCHGRAGRRQGGAGPARRRAGRRHGRAHAGRDRRGLVALGVRQLVVAGGETSGAVVQALNITQMKIGPQIDPGVPWCHAQTEAAPGEGLHLALKSGNFGTDDFFTQGLRPAGMPGHRQARAKKSAASARRCSSAAMCTPPPATSACAPTPAS